jgi:hypothetical protein
VLLYLAKHGQHVRSLDLCALHATVSKLRELLTSLTKRDSLRLSGMLLQLQPGRCGAQGVLRAGVLLTRLVLSSCTQYDGAEELATGLMQLPDLQHPNITAAWPAEHYSFWTDVLLPQQVTCSSLPELQGVDYQQQP